MSFTHKFVKRIQSGPVGETWIFFSQTPEQTLSIWRHWKAKNYTSQTPFKLGFCQFDTVLRDLEHGREEGAISLRQFRWPNGLCPHEC